METEWRDFEAAVATFLAALDPLSRVSHDVQLPDADTGAPRQRDVWIETSFGGHIPIKILVSCKRKKAKVNQQDMDAFIGELQSAGARKGVLYSHSGFTKHALAKAAKQQISCCILYRGRKTVLPEVLDFIAYYLAENVQLALLPVPPGPVPEWKRVIELPALGDGAGRAAIDVLADLFRADEGALRERIAEIPPPVRHVEASVLLPGADSPSRLLLTSRWVVHRAKLECWLVDGSYSVIDGDFKGRFSTPSIDTWSSDPGPGWERIDEADMASARSFSAIYRTAPDVATGVRAWAADQAN